MKTLLPFLLLFAACSREAPVTETTDTREPIAIQYVGAPTLEVREAANATAPVLATYQNGETVSVLARQGEWAEVRSGDRSGWVRAADLVDAAAAAREAENPTPKFRRAPLAVSAPGTKGEIYLEADVNSDGDVTNVRMLHNSTGSQELLEKNIASLRNASFHPIVQKGERKPFKYYHRVTY
ncbi:MAG TPA: SH3 domain-containing protein [Thermoanaerobaculia bacterium]